MDKLFGCLIAILFVFGLGAFESWVVMLLWNHVVLALWKTGPQLTFWLSYGIMLLLNIIGSCFRSRYKNE